MNVLVVIDNNWDNFAEISRRLTSKNINPEHRINFFYGKHIKHMSNICNQNMLTIIRKSLHKSNLEEELKNVLMYTKFCIIFHNFTEYNTLSSILINVCEQNKIPYFVFSEHSEKFIFNGFYVEEKFKKCVVNIERKSDTSDIFIKLNLTDIDKIDISDNYKVPREISQILNKLKNSYLTLEQEKEKKKIVVLNKNDIKQSKQLSYINYMNNKNKWIKEVFPRI